MEEVTFNLRVNRATADRLNLIGMRTEADTLTKVVSRALAVYDDLVQESRKGGIVVVKNRDGTEREILIQW